MLNWFINTMLLWCLLRSWKGDPGFVSNFFKSVLVREEKCQQAENSPMISHFIKTGETDHRKLKLACIELPEIEPNDPSLRIEHVYQTRYIYRRLMYDSLKSISHVGLSKLLQRDPIVKVGLKAIKRYHVDENG